MLSRFLSDKEARAVTRDAGEGTVDILIGTHRILQKDVTFKKLGLVIDLDTCVGCQACGCSPPNKRSMRFKIVCCALVPG